MSIPALKPEDVQFLAVHCSATPGDRDVTAADIGRWHTNQGFTGIGYHYVIRRNGQVEPGRRLDQRGAHVAGFNHCSIGICLVGGVDKAMKPENNFTNAQMDSLREVLTGLQKRFPKAVIQGHRDFPGVAKACPSFDVGAWWSSLQA